MHSSYVSYISTMSFILYAHSICVSMILPHFVSHIVLAIIAESIVTSLVITIIIIGCPFFLVGELAECIVFRR